MHLKYRKNLLNRSRAGNVAVYLVLILVGAFLALPLVYALVYFTNADIVFIYAMGQVVNVIKCIVGIILVKKGIWIHNMTVAPAES